jgi:hypothetical protein
MKISELQTELADQKLQMNNQKMEIQLIKVIKFFFFCVRSMQWAFCILLQLGLFFISWFMGIFFENLMSDWGKKRKTPIHFFKKYSSMSMSEEK